MNRMTEQDWDKVLNDWKESLHYQSNKLVYNKPTPEVNSEGEVKYIKILNAGKKTPKATFFITRHDMTGIFGFWCPKSAIIEEGKGDEGKYIKVYNWFTVREIEYT